MRSKDGQTSCETWWHLCQRGCVTHVEYCQGSLDKVDFSVRDLGWRSGPVFFQGVLRCYIVALMKVILMEMLEMEVFILMVV